MLYNDSSIDGHVLVSNNIAGVEIRVSWVGEGVIFNSGLIGVVGTIAAAEMIENTNGSSIYGYVTVSNNIAAIEIDQSALGDGIVNTNTGTIAAFGRISGSLVNDGYIGGGATVSNHIDA